MYMIKKFFLFIFFVCFLFLINIKVNGEQLTMLPKKYVQINIGDDSLIEEDNLEIVSGVVDWNKVGNYYITYKDRLDNIYKKEFIVFQNYPSINCRLYLDYIHNYTVFIYCYQE